MEQEVLIDSLLIYRCCPELVPVFFFLGGGVLMASHSLFWQSITMGGVVVHFVYNLMLGVQKHCTERTEEVPPPPYFRSGCPGARPRTAPGAARFTGLTSKM